MTHSWIEKLEEKGLAFIEAAAKAKQIRPMAGFNADEIGRRLKEFREVFSAYPELEEKRKAKLDPEFVQLYLRATQGVEFGEKRTRFFLKNEEVPVLRAEELEWTERIAELLEADQNARIRVYEAIACAIVWLPQIFAGGLKKQLGTKTPTMPELFVAIAQNLEWAADMLRGNVSEPPGRFNVKPADLVNEILKYQKEPLTQTELYEAVKAAGAEVPDDPEAFRLWLHRAKKHGVVRENEPHSNGRSTR